MAINDSRFSTRFNEIAGYFMRPATVVGVGSIGSNLALLLAKSGATRLKLVDIDIVEPENYGVSLYGVKHLGANKTEAMASIIKDLVDYTEVNVELFDSFKKAIEDNDIVYLCVDNMATRKKVAQHALRRNCLLIDARMSAEAFQIIGTSSLPLYMKTWFPDEKAFQERCTYRSTLYTAFLCAGNMVGLYRYIAAAGVENRCFELRWSIGAGMDIKEVL